MLITQWELASLRRVAFATAREASESMQHIAHTFKILTPGTGLFNMAQEQDQIRLSVEEE